MIIFFYKNSGDDYYGVEGKDVKSYNDIMNDSLKKSYDNDN